MFPQPPQFVRLVAVACSHPVLTRLSQLAKPALHVVKAQAPLVQDTPVAFAGAQTLPQLPQLLTAVVVLTSQPFVVTPSQLA